MTVPQGDPGITITLRDVWTELRVVSNKADQIAGQVTAMDHRITEIATDGHDHEVRIRSLEKGRWPLPSLAVLVAVCSIIVSVLVAYRK